MREDVKLKLLEIAERVEAQVWMHRDDGNLSVDELRHEKVRKIEEIAEMLGMWLNEEVTVILSDGEKTTMELREVIKKHGFSWDKKERKWYRKMSGVEAERIVNDEDLKGLSIKVERR